MSKMAAPRFVIELTPQASTTKKKKKFPGHTPSRLKLKCPFKEGMMGADISMVCPLSKRNAYFFKQFIDFSRFHWLNSFLLIISQFYYL